MKKVSMAVYLARLKNKQIFLYDTIKNAFGNQNQFSKPVIVTDFIISLNTQPRPIYSQSGIRFNVVSIEVARGLTMFLKL